MLKVVISLSLMFLSAFSQINEKNWWLHYEKNNYGANIQKSYKLRRPKRKIRVAVIDSGIFTNHPEIKNRIWTNSKEIPNNTIDDDKNGYVDDYKGFNVGYMTGATHLVGTGDHGTGVAGIIAAEHNGVGINGIMPDNVEIINISYKWSTDTDQAIARAIQYAVDVDADIINMSLWARDSKELKAAIKNADDKNIIIVCSAGNMGQFDTNHYPSKYTLNFKNVISVASSDRDSLVSSFSNFGNKYVDVVAPGKKIYLPAGEIFYKTSSGTSFAAPMVSGIVALILETHGKKAAKSMKTRLIQSSRKLRSMSGLVSSNGLINAYNAMTGQTSLNLMWDASDLK